MKRYLAPVLMLSMLLAVTLPAGAQEQAGTAAEHPDVDASLQAQEEPSPSGHSAATAPPPLTDTAEEAEAVYPEDVLEERVPVPEANPVPLPGAVDIVADPNAPMQMGPAALRRAAVIIGAHPDDEPFSVNYTKVLTDRYPVFVSVNRGERSGKCAEHGGVGSNACKAWREQRWHAFLDLTHPMGTILRTENEPAYKMWIGQNSARFLFDEGDRATTRSDTEFALSVVRTKLAFHRPSNVADPNASFVINALEYDPDHPDHAAVRAGVVSYSWPGAVKYSATYGAYEVSVTTTTSVDTQLDNNAIHAYCQVNPNLYCPGKPLVARTQYFVYLR